MHNTRSLVEGAIFSSIFIVILFLSVYTPIGFITIFALPIPYIFYTNKNGLRMGIAMFFITMILAIIFTSVLGVIPTFIAGSIGIIMGWLYQRERALPAIVGGTITGIINFVIILIITKVVFGINIVETMQNMSIDFIDSIEKVSNIAGTTPQTAEMFQLYRSTINQVGQIMPYIIIFSSFIIVFITHFMSRLIKIPSFNIPSFPIRDWSLPRNILIYFFISVIILMINPLNNIYTLHILAINLYPLLQVLLLIQGISFVFCISYYRKMGRAPSVLVVIASFLPVISQFVIILGMVDLGFNLRNKLKA